LTKGEIFMASDRLYKLASDFYKSKLWHKVASYELFGVRLPNGEIGYCSIMGKHGESVSLDVYVGSEGLAHYRQAAFPTESLTENEYFFRAMDKKYLSCAFTSKDLISEEELAAEKNFSRLNKIRFTATKSHPRFLKCQPMLEPINITKRKEEEILELALETALELGEKYLNKLPQFPPLRKKFPLRTPSSGKWSMEWLPPNRHPKYPGAVFGKRELDKLSKANKSKVLECELFILSQPFETTSDFEHFAVVMLMYYQNEKMVDAVPMTLTYRGDLKPFTKSFVNTCVKYGVPKKILVRTEHTFYFLEELCEAAGIELCEVEELPGIENFNEKLLSNDDDAEEYDYEDDYIDTETAVNELVSLVELMPTNELREFLNDEMKDILRQLIDQNIFSSRALNKLTQIL